MKHLLDTNDNNEISLQEWLAFFGVNSPGMYIHVSSCACDAMSKTQTMHPLQPKVLVIKARLCQALQLALLEPLHVPEYDADAIGCCIHVLAHNYNS